MRFDVASSPRVATRQVREKEFPSKPPTAGPGTLAIVGLPRHRYAGKAVILREFPIAGLLLLLMAPPGVGWTATWYVRSAGNDLADGSTPATAFRTVTRATQAALHGDRIVIGSGRYDATALIAERQGSAERPLVILGDETGDLTGDPAGEVVVSPASPSQPALYLHRCDGVTIEGLTFRGDGPGLRLSDCRNVRVQRCTLASLTSGISIDFGDSIFVESSVISRCHIGVSIRASHRSRLAHLTVVASSTAGILVVNSGPGTIRNCIFAANNSSYVVDRTSAPAWSSDHHVLTGPTGGWGSAPLVAYPAEWFAASGQERHSVPVAPAFANSEESDFRIDPAVRWGGGLPGAQAGAPLDPPVARDRDGRPFRVRSGTVGVGAYDYPDPTATAGWQPLGVSLPPVGVRQSAGIYRTDGSLVRMLFADVCGVRELWWDGRGELGRPAAPGSYEIRAAVHDVRFLDDGQIGDNGSPLGFFNADNPTRTLTFEDGRFLVASRYDEAGIPIRLHSASGPALAGANLAEKDFTALARNSRGDAVYGILGDPPSARLVRLALPAERLRMANGADAYPLLTAEERRRVQEDQRRAKAAVAQPASGSGTNRTRAATTNAPGRTHEIGGLAILEERAHVALRGLDLIRVIDLTNGNPLATWPLAGVADLAADPSGGLWAIAGSEVISLQPDGSARRRHPTSLPNPLYLAVSSNRLAVVDPRANRIALLDRDTGAAIRVFGSRPDLQSWTPVGAEVFRDLRGISFFPDGRLLLSEQFRVRCLSPDGGQVLFALTSNFMDVGVPNPWQPDFVYSRMGIHRVDPETGNWSHVNEVPRSMGRLIGTHAARLGGKPFVAFGSEGTIRVLYDVSDPLRPRRAKPGFDPADPILQRIGSFPSGFGKDGALVCPAEGGRMFSIPFAGLDDQGDPRWDFSRRAMIGPKEDPSPRKMTRKRGLTVDPGTGDFYYLAVTPRHNKMVPAWGADGTGVGKTTAQGLLPWFVLSSGGNYQTISSATDGTNHWIMACKSLGGQVDLFDPDGLRVATANWSRPTDWTTGFVDILSGIQGYRRSDGKPGAYVEDNLIGRFVRVRVDGTETYRRISETFRWDAAVAASEPVPADSAGLAMVRRAVLPKVQPLPVDGRWEVWAAAGVQPQIVCLPTIRWGRVRPEGLFDDFRTATLVGALAHDGEAVYAYFLCLDDTPTFTATQPRLMYQADGIELWLEEEQIGLGFLAGGQPTIFKYRHHDRAGKAYAANYPLPGDQVWGERLADVSSHPLARHLETIVGVRLEGRSGYALMGRIAFAELKLVGGLPEVTGRQGATVQPVTGRPGEILRIGVALDGLTRWDREQDFKVYWPASLMFSDPTRSVPFAFGG